VATCDTLPVSQSVSPFVEGTFVDSASDAGFDVINPSNGRLCTSIPRGSGTDVDRAVASSRQACADGRWSDAPPSLKKSTLHRFADLVAEDASALDALDAEEMGKPISVCLANAATAAKLLRFNAEAVDKVVGDVYASDRNSFVAQRRVPRGVVGAIVPWNFPTYAAMLKVAPALAGGNCVVLKPSELSSRSAVRLAELGLRAGLPPGVFNVVPGVGETVGRALGMHPGVDMISFTGSTDVGRRMLQYSGQSNMKVVLAECGGKSPQIVFDDGVDLDAAAESIARFLVTNQGQICSVGSRLLVQRSIEDALLGKVIAHTRAIRIGDALDPATTFGPLASATQCARITRHIELGRTQGAQLVAGGRRVLPESGGFFLEPTVFRDVRPGASLAQEEIFGPVLAVIAFEHEEEAARIANGTPYGLAAYVWTASLARGMRMAKAIRSSVRIHACAPRGEGAGHAASSEPVGQSGIGTEGGLAGIESYLRRQLVSFSHP
jgi:acyl-CoA reductase-like NAD-dependent aldehyde dehydrogenase